MTSGLIALWQRHITTRILLVAVCVVLPVMAWAQWATNNTDIYNSNNGNVGIGTASPDAKLRIDSSSPQLKLFNPANGSHLILKTWDAGGGVRPSTLAVSNDGSSASDVMTLLSNGNVGIGTISPGVKLDVSGAIWSNKGIDVWGLRNGPSMGTYADTGATSYPLFIPGAAEGFMSINTSDGAFFGLISRGGSNNDYNTVIGWGDDSDDDLEFRFNNSNRIIVKGSSGNVGIGTTNPSSKLDVNGDVTVSGNISAKYQDVAEWVPTSQSLSTGSVVVLSPGHGNSVVRSTTPYDTRVAGVVSSNPGIVLGEAGEGKIRVATTGRVKVRVDASSAPIEVGDLLVTSSKEGMAMKSQPLNFGGIELHRPGTLIGKALESLSEGEGEILVLLSLQ